MTKLNKNQPTSKLTRLSENQGEYNINHLILSEDENIYNIKKNITKSELISLATHLVGTLFAQGELITSPTDTIQFLTLKLAPLEREVFAVIFLDNRHRIIMYEEMFQGTISSANVFPREIIKRALELNSSALIISHNHPSGVSSPSESDKLITTHIKQSCDLLQIRLLDHILIGSSTDTFSFAEHGIL
jgi:DNA repair protein RadC